MEVGSYRILPLRERERERQGECGTRTRVSRARKRPNAAAVKRGVRGRGDDGTTTTTTTKIEGTRSVFFRQFCCDVARVARSTGRFIQIWLQEKYESENMKKKKLILLYSWLPFLNQVQKSGDFSLNFL